MENYYTIDQIANFLSLPVKTTINKIKNKNLFIFNGDTKLYSINNIDDFPLLDKDIFTSFFNEKCEHNFTCAELFAGAGGLALGLENAGFKHVFLNEIDRNAALTLKSNREDWNVINQDISDVDFSPYKGKVDLLSGGFPCQAFSYIGKGLGFADIRGTMFYQYSRALKEIDPKFFIAENVKGLLTHDNGRTIDTIYNEFKNQGYVVLPPKIFNCSLYGVPQKRERVIIIGIRKDIFEKNKDVEFEDPPFYPEMVTLRDAFYKGAMYDEDVPISKFSPYSKKKAEIMKLIPEGGNWKDLPVNLQKDYLGVSFNKGGGKTGVAKRLKMDHLSLTILCSPSQKQTERCHPFEDRPLTIRESARVQTFPDDWDFKGSISSQYKQIGNAVPVSFSTMISLSIAKYMKKKVAHDL